MLQEIKRVSIISYIRSMLFRNGNQASSCSKWVRPCTMKTGIRNKTVRMMVATITPRLQIHLLKNDEEKKGQYTSWGSGARSVTHSVGFVACLICTFNSVASRVLKDTKAAGTSYQTWHTILTVELKTMIVKDFISIRHLHTNPHLPSLREKKKKKKRKISLWSIDDYSKISYMAV